MATLPDLIDERFFLPRLQRLQECLCDELAKAGGPGLCFCGIVPAGRPPLGLLNCSGGNCGVAWVAPVGVYPTSSFPAQADGTNTKCAVPLAMRVQLGIARCHPEPKPRETMADAQALFEATRLYMSDMAAAKRALLCCFPEANRDYQVSLETWEALPPEGKASGGTWTAVIG